MFHLSAVLKEGDFVGHRLDAKDYWVFVIHLDSDIARVMLQAHALNPVLWPFFGGTSLRTVTCGNGSIIHSMCYFGWPSLSKCHFHSLVLASISQRRQPEIEIYVLRVISS